MKTDGSAILKLLSKSNSRGILNVCPAPISRSLPFHFPTVNATMDDLKAKHKKELKALDGEKRNQLKKTKATAGKGKKGKEALAA